MPLDPVTGGLVAGLGGSLLSGVLGHSAQSAANRANIKLQRDNQAWMERMSNTSWQRSVADMLKAGINPMLAVSQGGASTPSSSAATVIPEDALARSVSSAADKAMQVQALRLTKANADQAEEKAIQEGLNTDAMKVDRLQTGDYFKRLHDETEKIKAERMSAQQRARLAKTDADIRDIELKVAEQIQGYQVNSARAMSQIADKDVDIRELQAILMRLDIPEKEALAAWFAEVGAASPAAKAIMSIGQWLRMIFSSK